MAKPIRVGLKQRVLSIVIELVITFVGEEARGLIEGAFAPDDLLGYA
ncbi:hypothetical protein [Kribbella swartbergensis]